jgi:PKD repeat protein
VTGAAITNVTGSGATYTVTVNTGSGNGTIRLDLVDDDSIRDLANLPLGGAGTGNGNFTSGEIYTITWITIAGNAGSANASLSYTDGSLKTATADGSGNYSFTVPYNWSGTVTPSKTGFTFSPANKIYTNVKTDQTEQNYTASPITHTISGNAGTAGVTLSYTDGSPKTATADGSGNYSFTVSYNWSGTVMPSKAGFTFDPPSKTYSNVTANKPAQDYTANPITYTISGNAGTSGVTLSYTDGTAKVATTDGSGDYSFTVSYNWSGTVAPSKAGFTFSPGNRSYTSVLSDKPAQNYSIPAPSASFDAWPTTLNAGSSSEFHIVSTINISSCSWDYGDGSAPGTLCTPYHSHTYAAPGFYTVTFSVTGPGGTNSMTRTRYITVYPTLVVSKTGDGTGTVTSNPAGINCGSNCSGNFAYQTTVTLMAAPAPGSTFVGWSGGGCSGTDSCTVTVDMARTVAAHFEKIVANCPSITAWKGEYWVNPTLSGSPVLCRNDASLDFDWGSGSPDSSIPPDNFSAQWTRTINFSGGAYQFSIDHDDGARLYVDDMVNPVLDKWGSCCVVDSSVPIVLSDGNHIIRLEYYDGGGAANVRLWWIKLNIPVLSISGNVGVAGATLSYTDGSSKTVTANGSGNYSFLVPYQWSGSVTPSKPGYTFTPASKSYTNLTSNRTSENYTATAITYTISGNAGVEGTILSYTDGTSKSVTADSNGNYFFTVPYNWSGTVTPSQPCYTFNPASHTYSNVTQNKTGESYAPVLNPAAGCVILNTTVGGTLKGNYSIPPNSSLRKNYVGTDSGPVKVYSTGGTAPILTSERFIYSFQNSKAYAEMIGYPDSELATEYWFPWYNNKTYSTQLRVSNMGGNSAEVKVYAAGSLVETFTLSAGEARRTSYVLDKGPLHVVSTDGVTKILASERFIQTYQASASYSEMMGYPGDQLATEYWFPWYNNLTYSTQLRLSNMGGNSAEIKVYAGGNLVDTFTLAAGEARRISYNIDNGPLHVVSTDGVTPILASERFILTFGSSASYAEMMGYPGDQLDTQYCFPWYNNTTDGALGLSSQLRVSNMGAGTAQVKVYLAGTQLDSFSVTAGQGARKNYPTYNNGPLCVVSTDGVTPILASERFISTYQSSASYSEMMGYSRNRLDDIYWFPWYNNISYETELRMAQP